MRSVTVLSCVVTLSVLFSLCACCAFPIFAGSSLTGTIIRTDFGGRQYRGGETGVRGHGARVHDRDRERRGSSGNFGHKPTGAVTGLLFIIANITVVMSLLIKGAVKVFPLKAKTKTALVRFNSSQKKRLKYVHYILNIAALCTVTAHFAMSRCASTELPEAAYILMALLCVTGLLTSLKAGGGIKDTIRKMHTHPVMIAVLLLMILIGHALIEG